MASRPTSRELHDQHTDERNRLGQLARHEQRIRERTHRQIVGPLVQHEHRFGTPVPHRYGATPGSDHLDPPGAIGTDFEGAVV